MKKILFSIASIGVVAVVVVASTGAFFSDTETSTGNTFTAGGLDLKVDNECHYNEQADQTPNCYSVDDVSTTWSQTDLGASHKFFYFTDLKPGDFGEDTVSLHVLDNDAWGRLRIANVASLDVTCTEPEILAEGTACSPTADGELRTNTFFDIFLDQGFFPGFQCQGVARCQADPQEGNNVQDDFTSEPTLVTRGTIDLEGETHNLWPALAAVRSALDSAQACTADADGDGNTGYSTCHGLARDGRMVGSATYYFGINWSIPEDSVGNEAQTDTMTADMLFEIEQHRNNTVPFGSDVP